jgi:hypothetical protein
MTTPEAAPCNGHDPVTQPLLEFWQKYFEEGTRQTQDLMTGFREAFDPAAMRRRWLEALAESLDRYMRTPAFLEAMRRNFEAVTQLKSASEDWARDVSRATGIPRISDISGLFERLHIGQEAILARLAGIEHRLDGLEKNRKR